MNPKKYKLIAAEKQTFTFTSASPALFPPPKKKKRTQPTTLRRNKNNYCCYISKKKKKLASAFFPLYFTLKKNDSICEKKNISISNIFLISASIFKSLKLRNITYEICILHKMYIYLPPGGQGDQNLAIEIDTQIHISDKSFNIIFLH